MALGVTSKVVLGTALAGALGYLLLSDPVEGVLEYVYVDAVAADLDRYQDRTIKVHGVVVPGTITQKKGTTGNYNFVVEHGGKRLRVHYTNLVPDTFQEGGEVVLTGQLSDDGSVFESDEMSAKCPSKYEAEDQVKLDSRPGKT